MKKIIPVLIISALPAVGALRATLSNTKRYMMSDASTAQYLGGSATFRMQDGSFTLSPCAFHPSPVIVTPNQFCPLGTTGFIFQGDADRDGIRDDGSYWSLSEVVAASVIQPNEGDQVVLESAPPSKLIRPQSNFTDESLAITYNVLQGAGRLYKIALYDFTTEYGFNEEKKHSSEYVSGLYRVRIPSLINPRVPVNLPMQLFPAPESTNTVRRRLGFTLTGGRWSKGSMEVDPRIITRFGWNGMNRTNTIASDVMFFAIYQAQSLTGDIVQPDRILYPTPDVPQILDSPFNTTLEVVPFVFTKGSRGIARLTWTRNLATTAITNDTSRRLFDWRMRFVDSYEGHAFYEYPVGTPSNLRAPNADFDGDGILNFNEFAFTQDDGDDRSTTQEAGANNKIQPVLPAMVRDPVTLRASMNVVKRLNVGASVIYTIQYSTDGRRWTTITPRDRLFDILEDTEIRIEVRSKQPAPAVLFMRAVATPWR